MKGYIITVETPYKNGHYYGINTPKTVLDNKVWRNLEDAQQRIRTVVQNKCEKHNYRRMYDCLSTVRKNRLHSDMNCAIERDKFNTVKVYTIRPLQIG